MHWCNDDFASCDLVDDIFVKLQNPSRRLQRCPTSISLGASRCCRRLVCRHHFAMMTLRSRATLSRTTRVSEKGSRVSESQHVKASSMHAKKKEQSDISPAHRHFTPLLVLDRYHTSGLLNPSFNASRTRPRPSYHNPSSLLARHLQYKLRERHACTVLRSSTPINHGSPSARWSLCRR